MGLGGVRIWSWRLAVAALLGVLFLAGSNGETASAPPARQIQAPDQSTVPATTSSTTTTVATTTTERSTTSTTQVATPTTTTTTTAPPTGDDAEAAQTTTTTTVETDVLRAVEEAEGADAIAAQPQLTG